MGEQILNRHFISRYQIFMLKMHWNEKTYLKIPQACHLLFLCWKNLSVSTVLVETVEFWWFLILLRVKMFNFYSMSNGILAGSVKRNYLLNILKLSVSSWYSTLKLNVLFHLDFLLVFFSAPACIYTGPIWQVWQSLNRLICMLLSHQIVDLNLYYIIPVSFL